MKALCTFPGRHGDILWALPAIRALSWRIGDPVSLQISGKYGSLAPLLRQQPYLDEVLVDDEWHVQETAPMTPRRPPWVLRTEGGSDLVLRYTDTESSNPYDLVAHLAYRDWPRRPLPFETLDCLNAQTEGSPLRKVAIIADSELALDEPWIHVEPWTEVPHPLVVGWSDEHFELKYGVTMLALSNLPRPGSAFMCCAPNSRWQTEAGLEPTDWLENAARMKAGQVFLGCCSALHVLACAVGMPVICMEPNSQRHNSVFYPFGTTGRVRLVTGGDGQPTFDARHVKDAVQEALCRVS